MLLPMKLLQVLERSQLRELQRPIVYSVVRPTGELAFFTISPLGGKPVYITTAVTEILSVPLIDMPAVEIVARLSEQCFQDPDVLVHQGL